MGARGQCPLKLKTFCHLEVKFAVFWHKKPTTDLFCVCVCVWSILCVCACSKCSSRGNPRYRRKRILPVRCILVFNSFGFSFVWWNAGFGYKKTQKVHQCCSFWLSSILKPKWVIIRTISYWNIILCTDRPTANRTGAHVDRQDRKCLLVCFIA